MKWKDKLVDHVAEELSADPEWKNIIQKNTLESTIGIHLAIFKEPFLGLVYNGEKKIESRFSVYKSGPFQRIKKGDLVILKESGGPVTGVFLAGQVRFFEHLDSNSIMYIEKEFGILIGTSHDPNFWIKREKANFASLIEIKKVRRLPDFRTEKRDRRGWAILR